ncbi:hypothetical protein Hanom_Chr09g00773931 [Helianthus anomalus]
MSLSPTLITSFSRPLTLLRLLPLLSLIRLSLLLLLFWLRSPTILGLMTYLVSPATNSSTLPIMMKPTFATLRLLSHIRALILIH